MRVRSIHVHIVTRVQRLLQIKAIIGGTGQVAMSAQRTVEVGFLLLLPPFPPEMKNFFVETDMFLFHDLVCLMSGFGTFSLFYISLGYAEGAFSAMMLFDLFIDANGR